MFLMNPKLSLVILIGMVVMVFVNIKYTLSIRPFIQSDKEPAGCYSLAVANGLNEGIEQLKHFHLSKGYEIERSTKKVVSLQILTLK